jgi:peptide-methionine (R)-S-oxide reductase
MDQTDQQWRQKLTSNQYRILRQKGTEPPFSGSLLQNHETGDYLCAACGNLIFLSTTKFDSGSGWPSFYDTANSQAVEVVADKTHNMDRLEVKCAQCGSHLGHLFHDAPNQPTGLRYCINSDALNFQK